MVVCDYMNLILRILGSTLAVFAAAYVLPGAHLDGWVTALVVALILGVLNALVKPVLVLLTLPVTILTLGLFILVINAALVLLASWLVPGFRVDGFLWAIIFSLVVSVFSWFLSALME